MNMAEVSRNLRPGPVSCIRMYKTSIESDNGSFLFTGIRRDLNNHNVSQGRKKK